MMMVFPSASIAAAEPALTGCDSKPDARLEIISHDAWDRQVARFADLSYEQTAVFAAAKWGPERVEACRIMRRDEYMGGAVALRFPVPALRQGLYYIKHGPLWRRRDRDADWANYLGIVNALRREFCDNRRSVLTLLPRPHPDFAVREAQILLSAGFTLGGRPPDPNRYLIDLRSAVDPLAALSQKWRYNLKRARNEPLVVDELDPAEGFDAFATLHRTMVERKRFHNEDAIHVVPRFAGALDRALVPRVFLVRAEERIVTAAVIGKAGDMAFYLYGASNAEGLSRNAGYLLQWRIIELLRQSDQRWYDLGGEALDKGLRQFKRGLVGRQGVVFETRGEFTCCTRLSAKLIGAAANAARAARRTLRHAVSKQ